MPAPCADKDVVLSLSSPRYWYGAGHMPTFTVDVVSTATRPCSFNVGSRFLAVVVSAGGRTRIWSSSDCTHSAGSRTVALARGVPEAIGVTWDRKTSSPDCTLARATVQPGAFTATAVSGPLRSQAKIFVLGAPGVAVP